MRNLYTMSAQTLCHCHGTQCVSVCAELCKSVPNSVQVCQTLSHCAAKLCTTVPNCVPLCQTLCHYAELCRCAEFCANVRNSVPLPKSVQMCQTVCHCAEFCATVPNSVPLCQTLCHCAEVCATVLNSVPLCRTLCWTLCHCLCHCHGPNVCLCEPELHMIRYSFCGLFLHFAIQRDQWIIQPALCNFQLQKAFWCAWHAYRSSYFYGHYLRGLCVKESHKIILQFSVL